MSPAEQLASATRCLRDWLGPRRPEVAIVLGSGLGELTHALEGVQRLEYRDIPGFSRTTVVGHPGVFVAGALGEREVLCQAGRFHSYEGCTPETVALPVRVLAELGIGTLCLTNAAGGIRRSLHPGALMLIADHLNLTSRNSLIGPSLAAEVRFPDMSAPYDVELRHLAREVANGERIELHEGVYAGVLGPSYETQAEIVALERAGADAVGMSTVLEVVVARARGLRCLGLSIITNPAAGRGTSRLSHEEVMEVAGRAGEALGRLLAKLVGRLPARRP